MHINTCDCNTSLHGQREGRKSSQVTAKEAPGVGQQPFTGRATVGEGPNSALRGATALVLPRRSSVRTLLLPASATFPAPPLMTAGSFAGENSASPTSTEGSTSPPTQKDLSSSHKSRQWEKKTHTHFWVASTHCATPLSESICTYFSNTAIKLFQITAAINQNGFISPTPGILKNV